MGVIVPTSRRAFLQSAVLLAGGSPWLLSPRLALAAGARLRFGKPQPFIFEMLIERARVRAAQPYQPPHRPAPELVSAIDYDVHGAIRFKPECAIAADRPGKYPITFFHVGALFPKSIRMHELHAGTAREILYSPSCFDLPANSAAKLLPKDSGFAGFRLHESRRRDDWKTQDWLAFLGASYFRAIGSLGQYGLSARGVAVDTTAPGGEEFPDFTEFYLESPSSEVEPALIYALLDGPSLTGAYRFSCWRETGVTMEVESLLFLRSDIAQLGIAPLTSMYWYSQADKPYQVDWRPEVHDSDGLALKTAAGEQIWRPFHNPRRTVTSSFFDKSARGFGLLQRDRCLEHYLDGVNYQRRPSLWVEPLGDWGAGSVQLVEIPTGDEYHDNIVAFWVSAEPAKKGADYRYRYRLHWQADQPHPPMNLARVVTTRIGRSPERKHPQTDGDFRFVVEWAGKPLEAVPTSTSLTARVSAARGEITRSFTEQVPHTERWRAVFDLAVTGPDPVELRMQLSGEGRILSETWAYQFEAY